MVIYWISNILFDYLKYFVVALISGIMIKIFNSPIFNDEPETYWSIIILICLFGFSVI